MTVKEELLKNLSKIECVECPLRKGCNLNLSIYEKALCDELRDEK